jgi:hypothetical protein
VIKKGNKWGAQAQLNGERHDLGIFDSEIDAANAYDKFASQLPNKILNFPHKFRNIECEDKKDAVGKSSAFRGVSKSGNKWMMDVLIKGRRFSQMYSTEVQAATAYDDMVLN